MEIPWSTPMLVVPVTSGKWQGLDLRPATSTWRWAKKRVRRFKISQSIGARGNNSMDPPRKSAGRCYPVGWIMIDASQKIPKFFCFFKIAEKMSHNNSICLFLGTREIVGHLFVPQKNHKDHLNFNTNLNSGYFFLPQRYQTLMASQMAHATVQRCLVSFPENKMGHFCLHIKNTTG